jgi:hypothetical protein
VSFKENSGVFPYYLVGFFLLWQAVEEECRLAASITGAIAKVCLDDSLAAVGLAVQRCAHADVAISFASRVRL